MSTEEAPFRSPDLAVENEQLKKENTTLRAQLHALQGKGLLPFGSSCPACGGNRVIYERAPYKDDQGRDVDIVRRYVPAIGMDSHTTWVQ